LERQVPLDHLVPLELGGSNNIKNLWPQPEDPRPGAEEKDSLENISRELLCKVELSLAERAEVHRIKLGNVLGEKYVVPRYGPKWAAENRHGW
jgi:hypothetical protein